MKSELARRHARTAEELARIPNPPAPMMLAAGMAMGAIFAIGYRGLKASR